MPRPLIAPPPFGSTAVNHYDEKDVRRVIFPDRTAEAAKLIGVQLTGKISRKFWLECHAFDRPDEVPSAGISKATGAYKDQGTGISLSFFDLAIKVGYGRSFPEVVNALGQHFNVTPRLGVVGSLQESGSLREPSTESRKTSGASTKEETGSLREPSKKPDFSKMVHRSLALAIRATKWAGVAGQTWTYNDGFSTVRYDAPNKGKKVLPFHRDAATGLWGQCDPPGLLPLYRLDQIGTTGTILVLEGEKCADLAAGIGFRAVTSSHGAQSPGKTDWSPLAGRDVVILPDRDKPGIGYAKAVESILRQLDPNALVRILDLPDLKPDSGQDIEQWLETMPDQWTVEQIAAELQRLIDGIAEPESTPEPATEAKANRVPRSREALGLSCILDHAEIPIDWLWTDRFLMGSLNLVVGEGDVGKSFLMLDMIARITTGRAFPDQVEPRFPPSTCLYVTAEDRIGMTIRPRLRALEADLSRVHLIGMGKDENGKPKEFTIQDIDWLDDVMVHEPETRVIVLDPVTSFYGRGVDENSNSDIRAILKPLGDFAERHNVALVGISHFGKGQAGKPAAKILGSVALPNVARAVWCVVIDPDDRGRRLMLRVKLNCSGNDTGLAYRITPELKLEWEAGVVETRAADAVADTSGTKRREEKAAAKKETVIETIRQVLANGAMKGDDVVAACRARGVSKHAVWSHKEEAGVRARKSSLDSTWTWELSPDALKTPEGS